MNHQELYHILELPTEVITQLNTYEQNRTIQIPAPLIQKILLRNSWDEGIQELRELLADDPNGFKILWELLDLICTYTYKKYNDRYIDPAIFTDTMKFCTRFLEEHMQTYGTYKFTWAWWYPRQISLQEFRVGTFEYEFVDGTTKEINIHIPSDSDLSMEAMKDSLTKFKEFQQNYFPEWENVPLVCDSWLLTPTLKELLDPNSNILAFQSLFEIDSIDLDAPWFMDWVYPGYTKIDEALPERTSLQRNMKHFLLCGNKVGCAKGHLIASL